MPAKEPVATEEPAAPSLPRVTERSAASALRGGPGLAAVLRKAVVALLVLGVSGFLVDGANRPADPYLVRPPAAAAPAGAAPARSSAPAGSPAARPAPAGTVRTASALAPVATGSPIRPLGLTGFPSARLTVTTATGARRQACVLEAKTTAEQDQGLMNETTLGGFAGMAFVFGRPSLALFYMRDTPMPLSVAWFGPGGAFLASRDMPPCPPDTEVCPTYGPGRQYEVALEVPQGRLSALGVGPGSSVQMGGSCG